MLFDYFENIPYSISINLMAILFPLNNQFQSIFGSDVKDLRDKRTTTQWKPLDMVITLLPQQGSSQNREIYAKTNLHIICPSKYPKV